MSPKSTPFEAFEEIHQVVIDGISDNMDSLFQSVNYSFINISETTTNVFYVIQFISEAYTLQNNTTIDRNIISAGELVFRTQYLCSMKKNTNWYCKQKPPQQNIIVTTLTILRPHLDFVVMTDEGFLAAVEKIILKEDFRRQHFKRPNNKTREIYKALQKLEKSVSVCVPTDKTNSTRVIKIVDYKRWFSYHLLKADGLPLRPKVLVLFEDANESLEKLKMEFSVQEENYLRKLLATRAILSSKLLIKDHDTINKKVESPTRLVIPATNFTATFSKIGYLGIKCMLDKGKVNYSRVSVIQASDLKEKLEKLKIKIDEVTIASVGAINMYPSIKISTIKKTVRLFASNLTSATKKKMNLCLELVRFIMSSTLISSGG